MTADRNTPRAIVVDLEDTCNSVRRHAALLRCLTMDEGLDDLVRDALVQVADGLSDAHDDLRGKFKAILEQIVRQGGQQDRKSIGDILAAWDTNRKQQHNVTDDEAERLNEQEEALLDQIINTRAPSAGDIAAKVFVAKKLIEQSGSRWSDERDLKVLESVMADLSALGASDEAQPYAGGRAGGPAGYRVDGAGRVTDHYLTHRAPPPPGRGFPVQPAG